MKDFKEKIGEKTEKPGVDIETRKKIRKLTVVLLILSLTACERAWYGRDGLPGDAYVALTWQDTEPYYVDAGTGAVPPVFYWGEYYLIRPGIYSLYYEGEVWLGSSWGKYAWEVSYEIWEVPGERGDWYYNGANGPDNFFTLGCNPFGPFIGSSYKHSAYPENVNIVEESENEIIVSQKMDGWEMKVTYSRVEPKAGTKEGKQD